MTDELELLLEEEERKEEESAALPLLTAGRGRPGRNREGKLVSAERVGNGAAEESVFPEEETAGEMERAVSGEIVLLAKAGRREVRPEEVARGIGRQLSRTKRAAEYRRPAASGGVRLVRTDAGQRRDTGVTAGSIDREFQRDARRYDGGFTWL